MNDDECPCETCELASDTGETESDCDEYSDCQAYWDWETAKHKMVCPVCKSEILTSIISNGKTIFVHAQKLNCSLSIPDAGTGKSESQHDDIKD